MKKEQQSTRVSNIRIFNKTSDLGISNHQCHIVLIQIPDLIFGQSSLRDHLSFQIIYSSLLPADIFVITGLLNNPQPQLNADHDLDSLTFATSFYYSGSRQNGLWRKSVSRLL